MKQSPRDADLTPRGREMRLLIEEQEKSGLTARAFAESRGMKAATFNWWRREVRLRTASSNSRTASSPFVPVRIVEDAVAAPQVGPLRVEVAGDRRSIDVPHDFDAEHLRRLVEVLASC